MAYKKTTTITFVALAVLIVTLGLCAFKIYALEQKLKVSENVESELNAQMSEYKNLENIDSLLIKGQYRGALKEYNKRVTNKDLADVSGVRLRIEIAEQLLHLKEGTQYDNNDAIKTDSIAALKKNLLASATEIKKFDSLSFALEKAKVQLRRFHRNLKNRSSGSYLTFPSIKGSQMHYVGQVKNNMANGSGVAILDTGSRYEGDWKDNKRHGEGIFYWADGQYYEGSYVDDLRKGQGTYYWPNGEKYVGQWKDDKRNGKGIFYDVDGKVVTSGIWKEDKLAKPDKK